MTDLFEASYDTIATWINAPSRRNIATYRNTTEAHNAVMYSLLTEFRDGDNVVTTMMEHNSNFVPWYGMTNEILPRFGRQVECRLAHFDPAPASSTSTTWRTRRLAGRSWSAAPAPRTSSAPSRRSPTSGRSPTPAATRSPTGVSGRCCWSTAPNWSRAAAVDVQALDVDYLSFSFHKMLAPFGVGVLYAREHLLGRVAAVPLRRRHDRRGQVTPDRVEYGDLPWKFAAGTPNVLGVIVSAQALRLLADLVARRRLARLRQRRAVRPRGRGGGHEPGQRATSPASPTGRSHVPTASPGCASTARRPAWPGRRCSPSPSTEPTHGRWRWPWTRREWRRAPAVTAPPWPTRPRPGARHLPPELRGVHQRA